MFKSSNRTFAAMALSMMAACGAWGQCPTSWLPQDGLAGVNGSVSALTMWDPDGDGPREPVLVAGGRFTIAGSAIVRNIATWNPTTQQWSPLGTIGAASGGSAIGCLLVTPTGTLVAGGTFTVADGVPANNVAWWNGASWEPLGDGLDDSVSTLTVLSSGEILAGGQFSHSAGTLARYVARWNGLSWSPLSPGDASHLPSQVYTFAVQPEDGVINVGCAGGVWRWDGSTLSKVGSTSEGIGGAVYALLQMPDGTLLAGGDFYHADGQYVSNSFLKWTGSAWQSLSGLGWGHSPSSMAKVKTLSLLPNGDVLAGGQFDVGSGRTLTNIARWNPSLGWTPYGPGLRGPYINDSNGYVYATAVLPNGRIVAGGYLTNNTYPALDSTTAFGIAQWTGAEWRSVGKGFGPIIQAVTELRDGRLCALGSYRGIADDTILDFAVKEGGEWVQHLAPLNAVHSSSTWPILSQLFETRSGDMYVTGRFTTIDAAPINAIARWDGLSWNRLGGGVQGVSARALELPDGSLFVHGLITSAGGLSVKGAARWNGLEWSRMDAGVPAANTQNSFSSPTLGTSGQLYALYSGTTSGGDSVQNAAAWGGASWTMLPAPAPYAGSIRTLLTTPQGDLIACGSFARTGERVHCTLQKWTGAAWVALDPPISQSGSDGWGVSSAGIRADGSIYAFGNLNTGDRNNPLFGRWDGARWSVAAPLTTSEYPQSGTILMLRNGDVALYGTVRSLSDTVSAGVVVLHVPDHVLVTTQPADERTCSRGEAAFAVSALGEGAISYRWEYAVAGSSTFSALHEGWVDGLGTVSGTTTPTLHITEAIPLATQTRVRCVVDNGCGAATSEAALLTVCGGDFNCDQSANATDYAEFVDAFESGDPRADFDGDGAIDFFDYDAFVRALESPC